MKPALSGLNVEYRIIQLYSRDAGKREASFSFDTGQGTQDLGFRSEADVLFACAPAFEAATYAVTVEPEGGSPSGVATGPIVFTGKLIETVPSSTR